MNDKTQQLDDFFDAYAYRFNEELYEGECDVEKTAKCFADCFIESSPLGVITSKNDSKFREAVPKGYEFYRKIGITSMKIVSKEITLLDEFHAMVKVRWKSAFQRIDNSFGNVEFDVYYLLQTINDTFKIFAYITGDEEAVLKEEGLI